MQTFALGCTKSLWTLSLLMMPLPFLKVTTEHCDVMSRYLLAVVLRPLFMGRAGCLLVLPGASRSPISPLFHMFCMHCCHSCYYFHSPPGVFSITWRQRVSSRALLRADHKRIEQAEMFCCSTDVETCVRACWLHWKINPAKSWEYQSDWMPDTAALEKVQVHAVCVRISCLFPLQIQPSEWPSSFH